jgi:RNA polymerase sigma factor (sigma-70 family)
MADGQLRRVVEQARALAAPRGGPQSDGELLRRFVASRDETAFAALVRRHAPMVFGVCRRALGDHHDAEDVCQAAFLVLARRARTVRRRDSVASWLHGVAYRLAANLRRRRARRRAGPLTDDVAGPDAVADVSWREVRAAIDDGLSRLPERLRAPLVLCYLEGMTRDEAARHLGWPAGTLRTRLARGRLLLRGRLGRRGLALSAALLAAGLARGSAGPAPATLVAAAVSAATRGTVSSEVIALTQGALRAMLLTRVKVIVLVLLAAGALLGATAGGIAALRGHAAIPPGSEPVVRAEEPRPGDDAAKKDEAIDMTLRALEGAWKLVALTSNGQKAKDEDLQEIHYIFTAGGKWKARQDGRVVGRGTFTLDPTAKPKAIDVKIEETNDEANKGKTALGIYQLDGDDLTVCEGRPGAGARPAEFAAAADSRRVLARYKRDKGADTDDPPEDVADVCSRRLAAGGDENKRYYLIGRDLKEEAPKGGYGLVVLLPGGAGGADFNPFARRVLKEGLPAGYLLAELVAVKWTEKQVVVWPTQKLPEEKTKFGTEEFMAAVVKDVAGRRPIDPARVFALGWSSGGPPVYAASLAKGSPLTGSFVAMSVFKPNLLPGLEAAKGHAYFLYHSEDDRVAPFRFAKQAQEALEGAGAKVKLRTYDGGHGWRGDVYEDIRAGIDWLEKNHAKPADTGAKPSGRP